MSNDKVLSKFPNWHVFQKGYDKNCGPACLEMIYTINGKSRKVTDILNSFGYKKNGKGTFPLQLAIDLVENKESVKVQVSNTWIFSPAWANLKRKEQLELLGHWLEVNKKHRWFSYASYLYRYLKTKGEVLFESIDEADLKLSIDSGYLVLLCIANTRVWGSKLTLKADPVSDEIHGDTRGHYILVYGREGNSYLVADPYPTNLKNRHGIYKTTGKDLVNAMLLWDGIMVSVKRK